MGMFDTIRCNYTIPWPEARGQEFQTKDMEFPQLEKYEISEDGGLYKGCELVPFTGSINAYAWKSHNGVAYWYDLLFWIRDGQVYDLVCNKTEHESMTSTIEHWPQA